MMDFINLVYNEARLRFFEMRQYWFETIGALLFIVMAFLGLFYGVSSLSSAGSEENSLDGLVFGFIMWNFASGTYNSVTLTIIEDTQKGYLEQLFLSPGGIKSVLFAKIVVDLFMSILLVTITAYLVMALTGAWLTINFVTFYAIMLLAAPSLIGLGFIMCGLTLVFKRIEAVSALMNFALMALVAVVALPFNLFSLLPFAAGNSLAREVVLNSGEFTLSAVSVVTVNSLVYFVIGMAVFVVFERIAKKRNLIGQY